MVGFAVQYPEFNYDHIDRQGRDLFQLRNGATTPISPVTMFNGLQTSQQMLKLPMTIIHGPDLVYPSRPGPGHGLSPLTNRERSEGSWNLRTRQFVVPATQGGWTVFQISGSQLHDNADINGFFKDVRKQLSNYGIMSQAYVNGAAVNPDSGVPVLSNLIINNAHKIRRRDALDRSLEGRLRRLFPVAMQGPRLIFVVLSQKETLLYQHLKTSADRQGIQTICHVIKKGRNPVNDPNTIGDMLMKFNLKMDPRSINQAIRDVAAGGIPYLDKDTMLMGMDVTHAPQGAMEGAPSIAALVGSVNDEYSQFPAVFSENSRNSADNRPNEEIIKLGDMVKTSVERWKARHGGRMPKRIIAFRDGLAEEQLEMCSQKEIPKIEHGIRAAQVTQDGPTPELVVICTVKRHHVRFFRTTRHANNTQPPPDTVYTAKDHPLPGAMVDTQVVLDSSRKEYFMVSHTPVGKGTARPVHYIPLKWPRSMDLSTVKLARMTHVLCFMFGRSTRSVSLATPSYYADLAADRARCWVHHIYEPSDVGPRTYAAWQQANQGVPFLPTLLNGYRESMFYI